MNADNTARALAKAVSGFRYTNWRSDGPPPLIVNPQADDHALLAWCWGEAQHISLLCQMHLNDGDNTAADLADALLANVQGLTALLESLAARSAKAVQSYAACSY